MNRFTKTIAAFAIAATSVVAIPQVSSAQTYEDVIANPELTPEHSVVIRLYQAVFNRQPDVDGVVYWIEQYDSGEWSTRRIANFFATGDEFRSLYGDDTTDEEFVDAVYPNVLGRQPDAEGAAFWNGYLADGNGRAELILLISNAPEFIDANPLPSDDGPTDGGDDPTGDGLVTDTFDGTGPLLGYTTARPEALPVVGRVDGRYRAELTDNTGNVTLHFHGDQGRLDAKLVTFPFDYIVRNIGIGTIADSQVAPEPAGSSYIFSGVQVHSADLDEASSAHIVVGHRGSTRFTIEGKNTVNGSSSVNDIGANTVPDGRADIRIVGNADGTMYVYWQTPNLGDPANDVWQLYRGTGLLPGSSPGFGESVYIGLITYAYGTNGVPFVGTADSVHLAGE